MTTQNTLSESIKKKIEDEAKAEAKKQFEIILKDKDADKQLGLIFVDGVEGGYTAAAEQILQNPGDYGLAGAWVMGNEPEPQSGLWLNARKGGTAIMVWYSASEKIFMDSQGNLHDPDRIEWLSESATPSPRVQQLEQALKKVNEVVNGLVFPFHVYEGNDAARKMGMALNEVRGIATNALKTI